MRITLNTPLEYAYRAGYPFAICVFGVNLNTHVPYAYSIRYFLPSHFVIDIFAILV